MAELHMEGFDVGLEMSGVPQAFNDMLDCMYHGGKVALLGILPKGAGVDWDRIIFKGLTVQGIYGRKMYETWYKMTQMVLTGFPLQKVLTHQVHIDDFQKGFDLMEAGVCGKVVCSW
jgi:threonine 3-dehydrogenase